MFNYFMKYFFKNIVEYMKFIVVGKKILIFPNLPSIAFYVWFCFFFYFIIKKACLKLFSYYCTTSEELNQYREGTRHAWNYTKSMNNFSFVHGKKERKSDRTMYITHTVHIVTCSHDFLENQVMIFVQKWRVQETFPMW